MTSKTYILKCKICNKEYEYVTNDDKPCQTCVNKIVTHLHSKDTISKELLNLMAIITEKTASKEIKCKYCNYIYKQTDNIVSHVKKEHDRYSNEFKEYIDKYTAALADEIEKEFTKLPD